VLKPHEHAKLLKSTCDDARASTETQERAVTAVERCLDDYRRTADPEALAEIPAHVATIDTHGRRILDAATLASASVAVLKSELDR